ncbi:hypothetical protein CSA80_01505 [Candidatus Saccharibacteria bacterium]|nr:MAG: hypothetical protein CSA80_01505 [Candidatus Saccharibacteria bacterium]
MYIAYFDETGDDGYPDKTTDLFVLTSGSIHHAHWQQNYKSASLFRKQLKDTYGLPIKTELHARALFTNKKPYTAYDWDHATRLKIAQEYADFIASTDFEFINVAINKNRITHANRSMYKSVLDAALKFNVQRIENTIKASQPGTKFMIISDEGRVGIMKKTTRRIQKINFIPSRAGGAYYRQEIDLLIEDPLPKDSKQSYFIQFCDFVSFVSYLRLVKTQCAGKWHNRLSWLGEADVEDLLERLSPCLNLRANSGASEYGFVIYPKSK